MKPTWRSDDGRVRLYLGDCREVMRSMPEGLFARCVTDPPYALTADKKGGSGEASLNVDSPAGRSRITVGGFMGKQWDAAIPGPECWELVLRVLKPGAVLLAFGGTRTSHRLTCAIEDAGFEIRDCLMWLYGSGFPKSLDVSKAIDKAAGAEREVVGHLQSIQFTEQGRDVDYTVHSEDSGYGTSKSFGHGAPITAPTTLAAKLWQGWGSSLKPSYEPIVYAQKALTAVPEVGMIRETNQLIGAMTCLLLSNVKCAEGVLGLSRVVPSGVSVSVAMLVALLDGAESGELFARMGTFRSPETVSTCLNIARLWSGILGVVLKHGSTFTIGTATSLTTALRTLNCLLSTNIPTEVIGAVSRLVGCRSSVPRAGKSSTEEKESTSGIRKPFAAALVTLDTFGGGISAKNVVRTLRAIIPSVGSVLRRVLTEIATASGIPAFSEDVSIVESSSVRCRHGLPSTVDESAWPLDMLRPDYHSIVLAMKPLDGTFAENALRHGIAGLNVDGSRIGVGKGRCRDGEKTAEKRYTDRGSTNFARTPGPCGGDAKGRWPANLLLSHVPDAPCPACGGDYPACRLCGGTGIVAGCRRVGTKKVLTGMAYGPNASRGQIYGGGKGLVSQPKGSEEVGYADPDGLESVEEWECVESCPVRMLDEQSGMGPSGARTGQIQKPGYGGYVGAPGYCEASIGTASRFFKTFAPCRFCYAAKASRAERNAGCEGLEERAGGGLMSTVTGDSRTGNVTVQQNNHPTVKPLALMEYLLTLTATPTGGSVIDPFAGSGSTVVAAVRLGVPVVGIEQDPEAFRIMVARVKHALKMRKLNRGFGL